MRGPKLTQLKLANNKLAVLPSKVSTLVNLNTVVLDNNSLMSIPEVGSMPLFLTHDAPCASSLR